jgi:hypothetical protein
MNILLAFVVEYSKYWWKKSSAAKNYSGMSSRLSLNDFKNN